MVWDPNRPDPNRTGRLMLTFDPSGLSAAQRDGEACVVCHKKWPRPRVRVGQLPDRAPVHACDDCAEAVLPVPEGKVPLPRRSGAAL